MTNILQDSDLRILLDMFLQIAESKAEEWDKHETVIMRHVGSLISEAADKNQVVLIFADDLEIFKDQCKNKMFRFRTQDKTFELSVSASSFLLAERYEQIFAGRVNIWTETHDPISLTPVSIEFTYGFTQQFIIDFCHLFSNLNGYEHS